jgi:hypothetical protein
MARKGWERNGRERKNEREKRMEMEEERGKKKIEEGRGVEREEKGNQFGYNTRSYEFQQQRTPSYFSPIHLPCISTKYKKSNLKIDHILNKK